MTRGRRPGLSWRRVLVGAIVAALAGVSAGALLMRHEEPAGPGRRPPPSVPVVVVDAGGTAAARLDLRGARATDGSLDPERAAKLLAAHLPRQWTVRRGSARITYRLDRRSALLALTAPGQPVTRIRATPVTSVIGAPVVAQALRNNCESAALEVLLATAGARVPQLELQSAFPTSGPSDPVEGPDGRVWGDPALGYVGRPNGGGTAGGFGVYQRPVMLTAARYGVRLEDLTGRPMAQVIERVRKGSAVMMWIGLSDGPYGEWISPEGRPIRVNFGEHTVVLAGATADGRLRVINVLGGTVEMWTRPELDRAWRLLGARALAAPRAGLASA